MKFNPEFKLSTVREGRRTKTEAHEQGVGIMGTSTSKYREKVIPAVEKRIAKAVEKHRNWIEDELHTFPIEGSVIQPAEALAVFRGTLEKRIKQYARLNGTKPETLVSNGALTSIFQQAAFDFVESLRMSHQRGETVKQALALAGLSHWLDPRTTERLAEKYKGRVDQSVINRAVLNSSPDPDSFINSYIDAVKRLNQKYGPTLDKEGNVVAEGRADQNVIKRAAISNPKNPEAFIESYLGAVNRLTKKYADRADQGVIKSAALKYSKAPDAFIDTYLDTVDRLTHKYGPILDKKGKVIKEGKLDQGIINRAAMSYPKNPENFIDKTYLPAINRLTKQYGSRVGQNVINSSVASYPKNPGAFIDSYIGAVLRLTGKYEDHVNPEIVSRAALHYPNNPDAFVDWYLDSEKYLLSILPKTSDMSVVRKILLSNAFKSKERLSKLV